MRSTLLLRWKLIHTLPSGREMLFSTSAGTRLTRVLLPFYGLQPVRPCRPLTSAINKAFFSPFECWVWTSASCLHHVPLLNALSCSQLGWLAICVNTQLKISPNEVECFCCTDVTVLSTLRWLSPDQRIEEVYKTWIQLSDTFVINWIFLFEKQAGLVPPVPALISFPQLSLFIPSIQSVEQPVCVCLQFNMRSYLFAIGFYFSIDGLMLL